MGAEVEKRGIFKEAGYRKLILWKNAYDLRKTVYQITQSFPKSEYRRISQMRDAARSAKQNIQEGYRLNSRPQYIHFLGIAHASLHELAGDIEDSYDDKLISSEQFNELASLVGRTDYLFRRTIDALNGAKLLRASPKSPSISLTAIPQKNMKEATDEHGFSRMIRRGGFWHCQNSVIPSEEWLIPPAFGVPNAGLSVLPSRSGAAASRFHPCASVA